MTDPIKLLENEPLFVGSLVVKITRSCAASTMICFCWIGTTLQVLCICSDDFHRRNVLIEQCKEQKRGLSVGLLAASVT